MRSSLGRVEKLKGNSELWREIGQKDNPDFENSWVNFGSNNAAAAFYKDKFNRVWLKGLIKSGTVGAVPCFTLPSGYIPTEYMNYSSVDGTETPSARINIMATVDANPGEIHVTAGNNTFISLDGMSWRV